VAATIARIGAWLPRGWRDLFVQLGLYVFADNAYELARGMAEGRASLAFANGERIIDFQRATHTFFEPGLQSIVLDHQWLIDFANQIYLNSQFTIASGFLIWLYLFRNDGYYFMRNMLFVSMGLALIGYIGLPTAPPRMYPEYGFVDTINAYSSVNHDSEIAKLFINPFAAVPSMHCAVAMMIGITGYNVCRSRLARGFWAFWPFLVAWVTIVTANHYWFDVAAGWFVAALSFLIAARVIAQIKPELWAWSRVADHQRASA
jgi:membrane-associated phospholipid phosphatase